MDLLDEKIDEEKHFFILNNFQCEENKSLETFLKSHSIEYDLDSQGTTYIIRCEDSEDIIAFYTLKCSAIQIEENGKKTAVPTIELARLAVDSFYQRQGWGTMIFVNYILPKIVEVKRLIAVKAIMVFVESGDMHAINFYRKIGFKMNNSKIQNHIEESYSEDCKIMVLTLDNYEKIEKCLISADI